jgi:hypothetical protein
VILKLIHKIRWNKKIPYFINIVQWTRKKEKATATHGVNSLNKNEKERRMTLCRRKIMTQVQHSLSSNHSLFSWDLV